MFDGADLFRPDGRVVSRESWRAVKSAASACWCSPPGCLSRRHNGAADLVGPRARQVRRPTIHRRHRSAGHWNELLAGMGAGVPLCAVTTLEERLPERVLHELSEGVQARKRLIARGTGPDQRRRRHRVRGDAAGIGGNQPDRSDAPSWSCDRAMRRPCRLPNVARTLRPTSWATCWASITTGELGYADVRPAGWDLPSKAVPCRLDVFFPLTDTERRQITSRWR